MTIKGSQNRLVLHGPLNVANAESVYADLALAFQSEGEIVIALDSDADVDVTFLQTLAAAKRSAAARGRKVRLHAPPSGMLALALRSCGFASAPGATALDQILTPNPGSRA